jgi:hypothetical protein
VSSARPAGYLQATVISYLSLDLYLEGETVKLSPLCISLLCCRTTTNLLHAVNINKIVTRLAIKQFFLFFFFLLATFHIFHLGTDRLNALDYQFTISPPILPHLFFVLIQVLGTRIAIISPGEQFTPKSHFICLQSPALFKTIKSYVRPVFCINSRNGSGGTSDRLPARKPLSLTSRGPTDRLLVDHASPVLLATSSQVVSD